MIWGFSCLSSFHFFCEFPFSLRSSPSGSDQPASLPVPTRDLCLFVSLSLMLDHDSWRGRDDRRLYEMKRFDLMKLFYNKSPDVAQRHLSGVDGHLCQPSWEVQVLCCLMCSMGGCLSWYYITTLSLSPCSHLVKFSVAGQVGEICPSFFCLVWSHTLSVDLTVKCLKLVGGCWLPFQPALCIYW